MMGRAASTEVVDDHSYLHLNKYIQLCIYLTTYQYLSYKQGYIFGKQCMEFL